MFSFYARAYESYGSWHDVFNVGNVAGTSQPDVLVYMIIGYYMYRR